MTPAAMFLPAPRGTSGQTGSGMSPGPLERPVKTTLVITEECNLDCRLCYGSQKDLKKRPELEIDTWRLVIDELAANGVIWLYIEGGEPFLKPGFVDLLTENAPRMFLMVRTHGTLIRPSARRAPQTDRCGHRSRRPVGCGSYHP